MFMNLISCAELSRADQLLLFQQTKQSNSFKIWPGKYIQSILGIFDALVLWDVWCPVPVIIQEMLLIGSDNTSQQSYYNRDELLFKNQTQLLLLQKYYARKFHAAKVGKFLEVNSQNYSFFGKGCGIIRLGLEWTAQSALGGGENRALISHARLQSRVSNCWLVTQ